MSAIFFVMVLKMLDVRKIAGAFFAASLALALSGCSGGSEYTMLFPEIGVGNKKEIIRKEKRRLPKEPSQGVIAMFVEELVLGPQTPRLRPLFSRGTHVEFCFMGGNDLYVDISRDALFELSDAVDIQGGISLFEENIRKNFKNIENIVLFIDGRVVNE